jgi:hypothetical protein
VSCQVEPEISVIVEEEEIIEEPEPEIIEIPVDEPIIDDPIIEETEPTTEIITMEYINDINYHFPDLLTDKSIRLKESGAIYNFTDIGIDLPTTMMLYPNPVNTWMFINAVDGYSLETVETTILDDGEISFIYLLNMFGKFEYKGNLYYGEVDLHIVYIDGVLTINDVEGEFVE